MLKNLRKSKKGFTLIELIVVIAILGILAAVAVPRLTGFRINAAKSAIESNMKTIDSASSVYEADKGTIAADIAALVTAKYLQVAPTTTGVTYSLDASGRCTAAIAANTFGTHAAIAACTVEQLKANATWQGIQ